MSGPEPNSTLGDLGGWGGGATPSRAVGAYWSGSIPWVTPKDMGSGRIEVSQDSLTASGALRLTIYKAGSVAVVARSGVLRHSFPVSLGCRPFTVNQDMKVLEPAGEVAGAWAFHALNHLGERIVRTVVKVGTTVESLDYRQFLATPIWLPPLPEQRRIAEILDTVDEAIQKTEHVIEKLKAVKQGLLHDLLTRGIDENGELRDPDRHPEQFKDSPLGRIPREWEVVPLLEVVPEAEYGISNSLAAQGAVPILRMNNLKDGEGGLTDLKFSDAPKARALLLEPGDVLFNRTNSIDHVGRTGIWRGQLPEASFASYLVRLVPDPARLSGSFLNEWLNWPNTQLRIRRYATPGVHQVNINPTNLRRTTVALPCRVEEQERMVSRLDAYRTRVAGEHSSLAKLRLLKQGLMDDLLTGRVRVKVPGEAA